MSQISVIFTGVILGILLIFSCVTLNVSNYFHELEQSPVTVLKSEPKIVLRDRSS